MNNHINIIENTDEIHGPSILYKYRDWGKPHHKLVLTDTTLYLASPLHFEDTKDCNVPEIFPETENELYEFYLKKSRKEHPERSRKEHINYATDWKKNSILANPCERDKKLRELNEEFYNRFGVLSMTTNNNNDEMWDKYANNHKGFCVGYDTSLLFKYVSGGGNVEYFEELPPIHFGIDDFEEEHIKMIYHKEKKWEFEEEYRLHKMWKGNATEDMRSIKLPPECVVKIILGKNMSKKDKEEIRDIVGKKYPNLKTIERR